MPDTYTRPRPVSSFSDAATGATVHQITAGSEPSSHLYFTRPCWTPDGRYLLFVQQREGSLNYYVAEPGGSVRQLTHYPPTPYSAPFTQHMHRKFCSEEIERLMFRLPAIHPHYPIFAFAWGNAIHLIDIESGTDEVIYRFPESEAETPACGLHTIFTADGRDLLLVTTREVGARIDPPQQAWNFDLRDESAYISKIWRYDFSARRMRGTIFESNGEQSHILTCPWDADLIVWVNYLHNCLYTMRRDGTDLRQLLDGDRWGQPNHYNWDVANRRLVTNLSDPRNGWRTRLATVDLSTGDIVHLNATELPHPGHISVSPDGRWVVTDVADTRIGETQGLHLIDQQTDALRPLCRSSWGFLSDAQGNSVKSEYLHPNPSWSPDSRSVIFSSDFGSCVAQIYIVDLPEFEP